MPLLHPGSDITRGEVERLGGLQCLPRYSPDVELAVRQII